MLPHLNVLARLSVMDLTQKTLTIDVLAALNVVTTLRGGHGLAAPPAVFVLARFPLLPFW